MGGHLSSSAAAKYLDTIPKRVQHWSETVPDREMFVFYNSTIRQSYTFQLIVQMAGKFASRLRREYGFHKGDVIANTLPNSPERVITDLGIIMAGCVCINRTISEDFPKTTTGKVDRLSLQKIAEKFQTPNKIIKIYNLQSSISYK